MINIPIYKEVSNPAGPTSTPCILRRRMEPRQPINVRYLQCSFCDLLVATLEFPFVDKVIRQCHDLFTHSILVLQVYHALRVDV